jgi:hypothetical protein
MVYIVVYRSLRSLGQFDVIVWSDLGFALPAALRVLGESADRNALRLYPEPGIFRHCDVGGRARKTGPGSGNVVNPGAIQQPSYPGNSRQLIASLPGLQLDSILPDMARSGLLIEADNWDINHG